MALSGSIYQSVNGTPRYQLALDGPVASQPVLDVSPTPRHDVGTIIHARDVQNGAVELVYLKAPSSIRAGFVVSYNTSNPVRVPNASGGFDWVGAGNALTLDDNTPIGAPLAVSLSDYADSGANGAYGWFATKGLVLVQTPSAAVNGPAYAAGGAGSAGQVTSTARAGARIDGARIVNGGSGGTVEVQLDAPSAKADA